MVAPFPPKPESNKHIYKKGHSIFPQIRIFFYINIKQVIFGHIIKCCEKVVIFFCYINDVMTKLVNELTWVISLAIDEPIETPTSKTKNNKIHEQVQKQQWS
jgi:hypothetical protein